MFIENTRLYLWQILPQDGRPTWYSQVLLTTVSLNDSGRSRKRKLQDVMSESAMDVDMGPPGRNSTSQHPSGGTDNNTRVVGNPALPISFQTTAQ